MASAREELERLIRQTEDELRALKQALRSLERREIAGKSEARFIDMRPLDAMKIVLKENGNRMKREDLEEALMAGGNAIGKKRSHHNIRISVDTNVRIGNLCEEEGYISFVEDGGDG